MTEKLEHEIIAIAPHMFHGYHKPPQESCLHWGIECGDGWYDLIKNLVTELNEIDKNKTIEVSQIKEKYGTLRFYYDLRGGGNCDDDIDKIIDKYEAISAKTCEVCGKAGTLNRGGWISCRCDEHKNLH